MENHRGEKQMADKKTYYLVKETIQNNFSGFFGIRVFGTEFNGLNADVLKSNGYIDNEKVKRYAFANRYRAEQRIQREQNMGHGGHTICTYEVLEWVC